MNNQDLVEAAVSCNRHILTYMGDRKSTKLPSDSLTNIIEELLVRQGDSKSGTAADGQELFTPQQLLADELYCQLIRQQCRNPSTRSEERGWHLMVSLKSKSKI